MSRKTQDKVPKVKAAKKKEVGRARKKYSSDI